MFVRMNEHEAEEMLANGVVGRLGCIVNGAPYVVPVNYYFEERCAYSHSLPGLKISALRENPKACLQVDEVASAVRWRSVLAFGDYEEVVKPRERSDVLNKLLKRFPMLTPVESAIAADAESPQVIVYRIRFDQITGAAEE